MATVSLKNVKKNFGLTEVIQGISTDIKDGEFIVIVGPSGCGKSTLLRMIAGLETVTEGEIFIDEDFVNEKEPMDRDIAMVFQNYALYPHMSVRQNMGPYFDERTYEDIEHSFEKPSLYLDPWVLFH